MSSGAASARSSAARTANPLQRVRLLRHNHFRHSHRRGPGPETKRSQPWHASASGLMSDIAARQTVTSVGFGRLKPLVLSNDERHILEHWARRGSTAQGLSCGHGSCRPARRATGTSPSPPLGINRSTVTKWRHGSWLADWATHWPKQELAQRMEYHRPACAASGGRSACSRCPRGHVVVVSSTEQATRHGCPNCSHVAPAPTRSRHST